MALDAYQDIFCRMIASVDYRASLIADPDHIFASYELTPLEQRRLLAMAVHPGMRVNTAIHRANRLAPLDQTLPFTCFLLGARLGPLVDRYWIEHPTENLQLPAECARFADFLEQEIEMGRLVDSYIEEVLAFERVCTELRFFTEEELRIKMQLDERAPVQVRILRFNHDPEVLLESLSRLEMPPFLAEQEHYLAIDARSGDVVFRILDPQAVAALIAQ